MKSIDVFCHLMPQKYAELAMNESPNKSHMFVSSWWVTGYTWRGYSLS